MMDNRTGASIILMAFLEIGFLSWFYGTGKFFQHIKEMGMTIPVVLKAYWTVSWNITTPLVCLVVLIKGWIDFKPESFLDYTYEPAVQALGWVLELYPIAITLLVLVGTMIKRKMDGQSIAFVQFPGPGLRPKLGPMLTPTAKWGARPHDDKNVTEEAPPTEEVKKSAEQGLDNVAFQKD